MSDEHDTSDHLRRCDLARSHIPANDFATQVGQLLNAAACVVSHDDEFSKCSGTASASISLLRAEIERTKKCNDSTNDFASGVVAMARACKAELRLASQTANPLDAMDYFLDSVIEHDEASMRKIEEQAKKGTNEK